MTKKSFKRAMVRGLGRCVIELEKNEEIEQYREIVLSGCCTNFSYDVQSEGIRSEYMYILQSKYKDDYFETKIIEKYQKNTKDS